MSKLKILYQKIFGGNPIEMRDRPYPVYIIISGVVINSVASLAYTNQSFISLLIPQIIVFIISIYFLIKSIKYNNYNK